MDVPNSVMDASPNLIHLQLAVNLIVNSYGSYGHGPLGVT